jgi:hypothetical protein
MCERQGSQDRSEARCFLAEMYARQRGGRMLVVLRMPGAESAYTIPQTLNSRNADSCDQVCLRSCFAASKVLCVRDGGVRSRSAKFHRLSYLIQL